MCVLFKLLSNISHTSCLNCLRFLNRIYIVCTLCVKLMKLSLQRWLYPCKIVLYCILFLVIRTDHFFLSVYCLIYCLVENLLKITSVFRKHIIMDMKCIYFFHLMTINPYDSIAFDPSLRNNLK